MENAIELRNIKKIFRYFKNDFKVFYWLFTRKGFTKEFRVLDGINLDIKKGEVVGILGKNGAGKSTILKIICGIYFPSSGTVNVNGTIASLIELGAGFNGELTGRENIYLKGTLLGLSKSYIDNAIDDILDFADIGEYIDMPLGTYSSGMAARLGFSLAVNADPDILIIDEVFAVGDKNFQQKSRAKTEELLKSGKTVLFVSHSEQLIEAFCDRVIYLKDGHVEYDGNVKRGLALYHADNLNLKREATIKFDEVELVDKQLRIRLEYGIGAEGNIIKEDDLNNFSIKINQYDIDQKIIIEEDIIEYTLEKINDSIIDLYLNVVDIVDDGFYNITFKYKDSEELLLVANLNANERLELNSLDLSFDLDIRNINNKLCFSLKSIELKKNSGSMAV